MDRLEAGSKRTLDEVAEQVAQALRKARQTFVPSFDGAKVIALGNTIEIEWPNDRVILTIRRDE